MALDQSIVVVNEYTLKTGEGKGSRGATPGKYVLRYMARDKATQTLSQIRRDNIDTFVTRYMARADAVQELSVTDDVPSYPTRKRRTVDTADTSTARDDNDTSADVLIRSQADLDALAAQLRHARAQLGVMDGSADTDNDEVVNKNDVKYRFRQAQLLGGVGFTRGNVSMSHEALTDHAAAIQSHFDAGKTVMKTVLSFDHDYLREHNIVPKDMPAPPRGGYRGMIDEMKLRYGVMAGVDRMGRTHYDDLDYIGVIQVDTEHVHAHLVLVDRGDGTLMRDGTQRGKINADARSQLRRGMDVYLDEHSYIAHYSASVDYERQNVVSFIKNWAVNTMVRESSAQWIVSNLPNDETQWRAGSNRESMRRANAIVRGLVEERLDDPHSPMHRAMQQIEQYADARTRREGLARDERDALVSRGRTRVIDQAVNGVYGVLAALPRADRQAVSTPLMRVMTMDADELYEAVRVGRDITVPSARQQREQGTDNAAQRDTQRESVTLTEFGMRLRTYTSRRDYHLAQREVYETAMRDWEKAYQDGRASLASKVMFDHAEQEAAYHARAGQKYTQVFGGVHNDTQWREQWEQVAELGDRCVRLGAMRKDTSLRQMKDEDAAERQGIEIYGVAGAGSLTRTGAAGKAARDHIDAQLDRLRDEYAQAVDAINRQWAQYGAHIAVVAGDGDAQDDNDVQRLHLRRSSLPERTATSATDQSSTGGSGDEDVTVHTPGAALECVVAPEFSAAEVQGVDMHDMRNEITEDVPVGKKTRQRFSARTAARRRALDRARSFMEASGQSAQTVQLESAERDISRAEETVELLDATDGVLISDIAQHVARLREDKAARAERSRAADAQRDAAQDDVEAADDVPQRTAAREAYEVDSLDGMGYTFNLDKRVRAKVNTEMDAAARRAVDEYTRDDAVRQYARDRRRGGPHSPGE